MIDLKLLMIPNEFRQRFPPRAFPPRDDKPALYVEPTEGRNGAPFVPRPNIPYGIRVYKILAYILDRMEFLCDDSWLGEVFRLVFELNKRLTASECYFPVRKRLHPRPEDHPYRDHFLHAMVVFVLGDRLLQSEIGGRKVLSHLLDQIRASQIGKDALDFAAVESLLAQDIGFWESALRDSWRLAALCHDIVFALEPGIDLERTFFGNTFFHGDSHDKSIIQGTVLEALTASLADPTSHLTAHQRDKINAYFVDPSLATLKNKGQLDHGQFFACLVLKELCSQARLEGTTKQDCLALFFSLVAIFRHDEWSKPKYLNMLSSTEDPWSIFFCFVDLLSEIRLIWDSPSFENSTLVALWRLKVWLPFNRLRLIFSDGEQWQVRFTIPSELAGEIDRGAGPEKWTISGFHFGSAVGYGEAPEAVDKRTQYHKMLQVLGLCDGRPVRVWPPEIEGDPAPGGAA